jgi:hypothetical protein
MNGLIWLRRKSIVGWVDGRWTSRLPLTLMRSHEPHPLIADKSADMPCIVVFCCIYVSQAQFGLNSQTLILAMTEKQPPVMQSVNFHAPCCKAGKSRWFWGPGKICISIKDRPCAIYLSVVLQYLRTRSLLFLDWRPLDLETRAVLFNKKNGDCFFSLVSSASGLDVLQEKCIGCFAF